MDMYEAAMLNMTAASILDGRNTSEYMSVHDVPQLVANFLGPSPCRPDGSHIASACALPRRTGHREDVAGQAMSHLARLRTRR